MSFDIKKGGKDLPPRSTGGRLHTYPYMQLEVGDSFFVPGKNHQQLSGVAANAKKYGIHLVMRRDEVDGVRGIRMYRQS